MQIILGSQSPRRKEIMEYFSLPFVQIASNFDEESIPFSGDPAKYATTLSQKKAEVLAQRMPDDVILTADSVVFCNGKIYNKPADEKEAFQYLIDLGKDWHQVYTGVTVRKGDKFHSGHEETHLLFHKLTEEQIKKFHRHCFFLDKAGGYAIEKSGNLIVSRIEGCYYNVLGLPINLTRRLLLNFGIDLWDFLKSF
jgi:septum formation protein